MNEQNESSITVGPNGMNAEDMKRFWADKAKRIASEKQRSTKLDESLQSLLGQVQKVNYQLEVEAANGSNVKCQHYIVITIEELLKLARKLRWGLCVRNGHVYVYNGQYWKPIPAEEFKSFLGKVGERMGMQSLDAKYYQIQDQLYKQFIAAATLPAPSNNSKTVLINLMNGTYEITAGGNRLREFDRNDFLTYQLLFDYNEEVECPIFQNFLARVLPDKQLQLILSEFIAYVFAKQLKLDKCLLLYGSGANGKSVFFEVIKALLGKENVSFYTLKNLNEEHNRADIVDKLLNYGSEINASIETDTFKMLVSGESVQARLKYQNSVMIDDYARLAFNCNELPKDVEHTEAYFRRYLIIPFNVTIPEEERDPQLAQRIMDTELSGVFNWVLRGLVSLLANNGFTQSEVVRNMINEYKLDSDSVYQFLTDSGYEKSVEPIMTLKTSFDEYSRYCAESGYHRVLIKKYAKRLRHHGIPVERSGAGGKTFVFYSKSKSVL